MELGFSNVGLIFEMQGLTRASNDKGRHCRLISNLFSSMTYLGWVSYTKKKVSHRAYLFLCIGFY